MTAIAFDIPKGGDLSFPSANTPGPAVRMEHKDCQGHNCVDEYCADYDSLIKMAPVSK